VVPYARAADGVRVAVVPLYPTVPAMAVPSDPANVKVEVVIEDAFIAMLKVAVTVVSMATPVAP
jgi:hypothetical protein